MAENVATSEQLKQSLDDTSLQIHSTIYKEAAENIVNQAGGDVVSRGSIKRPQGVDPRPRNNRRKKPSSSSSGGGGGALPSGTIVEDDYMNNTDNGTGSMVYLNMNTDQYTETDYNNVNVEPDGGSEDEQNYNNVDEYRQDQFQYTNGGPEEGNEVYINGPRGDFEAPAADLETNFPSHVLAEEGEDNYEVPVAPESSEDSAEIVIQGHDPPPRAMQQMSQTTQSLTLEDYIDLPASYNLMWGFIATGIAFVTGVLVMVLYTHLDAANEGPTVKVMCVMIIIPCFFFFLTCGLNCYGRCLAMKSK